MTILQKCDNVRIKKKQSKSPTCKSDNVVAFAFLIMRYSKQTDPFYKSAHWRRLRKTALERDHYMCQDCLAAKRRGEMIRPRSASVVHHILPRDKYPELALDLDNLVSLCDACHNKRHPEKGGGAADAAEVKPGVRIIKV